MEESHRENSGQIGHFHGRGDRPGRYILCNRAGGVSRPPYDSLNIGLWVGDSADAVRENRRRVKTQLGVEYLVSGRQVHGENVYLVTGEPDEDLEVDGYDALITRQPGVGLVIQHADCQAVLLYDRGQTAIGAIHSGWRGSVANIIGTTIAAMTTAFGTNPSDIEAVISPSLGPCCAEFVNYALELPLAFHAHTDDACHVNFWEISRQQLLACGVPGPSIALPDVCTSCSADYFSYRRACRENDGITGRNCSAIALVKSSCG